MKSALGILEPFWLAVARSRAGIRDVIVLLVPQGVSFVKGLVAAVLIARGLGSSGLGTLTLVLSLGALAQALSDLGIGKTAIRYASLCHSRGEEQAQWAVLRWALRLRLALTGLAMLFLFLLAPWLAERVWRIGGYSGLIQWGLLLGVCGVLASAPITHLQSLGQFGKSAAATVGQNLIALAAVVFLAVLHWWTVGSVVGVTIVSAAIGGLAFLSWAPRDVYLPRGNPWNWARAGCWRFWRCPRSAALETANLDASSPEAFAFYNLLSTIIVLVTQRLDVWLLGVFVSTEQIGQYSVALRFTLPLAMLLSALTTALWPRASAETRLDGALALLRRIFLLSFLAALPCLAYAWAAPLLGPWLFGAEYAGSVPLGQILCLRFCVAMLVCPAGVVGYTLGLARVYWVINLLQLAATAAVMAALIPAHGPMGAAIGLLVNDVAGFALFGAFVLHRIRRLKLQSQ